MLGPFLCSLLLAKRRNPVRLAPACQLEASLRQLCHRKAIASACRGCEATYAPPCAASYVSLAIALGQFLEGKSGMRLEPFDELVAQKCCWRPEAPRNIVWYVFGKAGGSLSQHLGG